MTFAQILVLLALTFILVTASAVIIIAQLQSSRRRAIERAMDILSPLAQQGLKMIEERSNPLFKLRSLIRGVTSPEFHAELEDCGDLLRQIWSWFQPKAEPKPQPKAEPTDLEDDFVA